jgi:2-methylisocitrate lyase-like PEP mutase family enzyme
MSFTMEIYNLLVRYTKDFDGRDITVAELQALGWWRCVWGTWRAKAYYKMDGFYECLEDVPEGLHEFTIQTDKLNKMYYLSMGKQETQVIKIESCKKFYGQ